MNPRRKIHPFEAIVLTALFAAGICLPLVKQWIASEPDTSAIEKRPLAQWPKEDLAGNWKWWIKAVPQKFDAYYSDHFGFRYILLKADTLLNIKWFNVSQRAIIGKNGWLFLKMEPPLFTQKLGDAELAKWKSYLEHRQQWLAARGVRYLFVVPADKDSIYPEFLPLTSRQPPAELPVDQLARYLRETKSSVQILSLREALLTAKALEQEPLYYRQDTHWNTLGGFYGCEAIVHRLSAWFPALKSNSRRDYRLVFEREPRDVALLAGLPDDVAMNGPVLQPLNTTIMGKQAFHASRFSIEPFVTQRPGRDGLPHAVVLGDSFTEQLGPYLSDGFSRVDYFWTSANILGLEKKIAGTISREKPDIFIEERVQRFLPAVPDERTMFGGTAESGTNAIKP